ncbi:MAG: Sensory box histidine kinase [Candidatus Taylorbacteria bacterium]|nr:Sensory box histidine kinase [Candidatus Taylorbacteria bacterium]
MTDHTRTSGKAVFQEFRLRKYYYLVEGLGLLIPIALGLGMYLAPDFFTWMRYPQAVLFSIVSLAVLHVLFFALHEKFNKKIFFTAARYSYSFFFMCIIISAGGLGSPFIFLLVFPVIVSAVYLDERITEHVGLVLTIMLAMLIVLYPRAWTDPSLIIRHVTVTVLFGLICYLMHRIVVDTLHQKNEKEEIDRRLSEFTQIEQLKHDFLSVAQHQLRTPLAGLRWALETLKEDVGVSPQNRELIDESILRVGDAIGIVNEMLTTAEGSSTDQLKLVRVPVDVPRLIKAILGDLEYVALVRSVKVNLNLPEKLEIEGDFKKLKAAFLNIVDNAFKYSPKGNVDISVTSDGEKMVMSVTDTGIGISEEDVPYVFDRLHRGKNAISLEPNESGVGLYTTKKIIELHGGTISVSSVLGKGTTVTAYLPIKAK